MDLLVLCDREGVVDMTAEAISRRTNVPSDLVSRAIDRLSQVDDKSRSKEEDGRRLVALDSHRDWGWQIVNYHHYRDLVDEESRRSYFRDKQRERRARLSKVSNPVKECTRTYKQITQVEVEADVEVTTEELKFKDSCAEPLQARTPSKVVFLLPLNDKTFHEVTAEEILLWKSLYPGVDIEQQCRAMIGWLSASPTRKKTRRGINKFMNGWFSREQDRPKGNNGNGKSTLIDSIRDSRRMPDFGQPSLPD